MKAKLTQVASTKTKKLINKKSGTYSLAKLLTRCLTICSCASDMQMNLPPTRSTREISANNLFIQSTTASEVSVNNASTVPLSSTTLNLSFENDILNQHKQTVEFNDAFKSEQINNPISIHTCSKR